MEATFDNKTNLLSANVRSCVDNSVLYNISTTHNLWGRTVTVLKDANPALGSKSPIVGAIYWRERLFEVNGHRKSISDIKSKPPGFEATEAQSNTKSKRRHSRSKSRDERKGKNDGRRGRDRSRSRDAGRTRGKDNEKSQDRRSKSRPRPESRRKKAEPEPEAKIDSTVALIPGCAACLTLARRSTILFAQISLGEWWRSVTCNTRYWRWSADRTEYELVYHHEQWKALINSDDDDINGNDEKAVTRTKSTGPARPPHMRTRSASVSFGARDLATINYNDPGRNSGFSAKTASTVTNVGQQHQPSRHSRHSSARFSIGTATRFSGGSVNGSEKASDDGKRSASSSASQDDDDTLIDPEKLKEERRTSASLDIPYRNHLFHKTKPAVLKLKQNALLQDEVFLLLVLIYSETKRQDSTNSSGGW